MCMAFFVIHGSDPFAVKELAFVYLVVFILILKSASNLNGNLNCSKELEHYAS